ncbi:HAMP domain-containing protein [Mucilaginibacter rubeus]|uniref:histidine kinase n=1 Tax=Mucilaginibacter rubeus TaxID=2027860 RepID=A0AAE6JJ90_9SPHI|nr:MULTISPECIES: HAMP domain-containing protein [Mucilaginibacter]QEM06443.1 HAMP domain-containing protein [Mucilaginibacter rubeus]QEM19028.1 HAMP domain-containing protein [Mucilaginibacter gossypii]QTE44430.1 HAMP domain-containing protein [Mucilaginibacter rubeus]QTE51029.1 HAMP domain-containing protein [Mucilaginibacter rubeus]QTE56112.1 HAMP domain-containing protein [Mucilaginibacter rubeus]
MNLKQRFSFIFSCLFSVLLATVTLTVYVLFAHFRQDEFAALMTEKAQTTAKLLIEVKEIDYKMQKIIDSNSINKLYNENTQIYNEDYKLIYNSNDTLTVNLTKADLNQIKTKHRIFKKTDPYDILGLYYTYDHKHYYVVVSAEDTYDNSKLNYLKYLLLGAFIIGTTTVWVLSFRLSKRALKPLDNFRQKIQEITDSNLKIRLSEAKREDEINALANSFNQMMDRIDNAYDRQKEFTGNASHELRTPVARIAAQIENLLHRNGLDADTRANLASVFDDTFQLSEIISSLVAIADINSREHHSSFAKLRLDELIYSTVADLSKIYPDFKLKFEIENNTGNETDLEISGDETLLKIALINLFKNAYLYSDDHSLECLIRQENKEIELLITNSGEPPLVEDTATLFTTFYRGSNVKYIAGSGIGLGIVKRVLEYHRSTINYQIIDKNTNQVQVIFPLRNSNS